MPNCRDTHSACTQCNSNALTVPRNTHLVATSCTRQLIVRREKRKRGRREEKEKREKGDERVGALYSGGSRAKTQ
eukprot:1534632-Heterocapsa_arctica.AAC.1